MSEFIGELMNNGRFFSLPIKALEIGLKRSICIVCLGVGLLPSIGQCEVTYKVYNLSGVASSGWSYASGVNNLRQVAGEMAVYSPFSSRGFYWSFDTGMVNLGVPVPGRSTSRDLNDQGQAVGWYVSDAQPSRDHPFIWDSVLGMRDIADPAITQGRAFGINESGQVAGRLSGNAFLWDPVTGVRDLGSIAGFGSEAWGLNDVGTVVGRSTGLDFKDHAFYWTKQSGIVDLGLFGGTASYAVQVNNSNEIVGWFQTSSLTTRAYLANTSGGFQELGDLGAGWSLARGINNRGQVVGSSGLTNGGSVAMIWDPVHGMRNLNDLIDPSTSGITVRDAFSISDTGVIVGQAVSGIQTHAFVAIPVDSFPQLVTPDWYLILIGSEASSQFVSALYFNDDARLAVQADPFFGFTSRVELSGKSPVQTPSQVSFILESHTNFNQRRRFIHLFNYVTSSWEQLSVSPISLADTRVRVDVTSDPGRFVEPSTRNMKARIGADFPTAARTMARTMEYIDRAVWEIEG